MKNLLGPLKVELRSCVGTLAEIEQVRRYLPASVLFRVRYLEVGTSTWHIGRFLDGSICRASITDEEAGSITEYSEGFLLRRSGKRWLKVTAQHETELEALYGAEEVFPCRDGFIRFSREKRYGFLDKDGRVVVEPVYKDAHDFCGGFACVEVFGGGETKWLIDTQGRKVLSVKADYISDVYEKTCLIARVEDGTKVIKAIRNVGGSHSEEYLCAAGDYWNVREWKGERLFCYRVGNKHGLIDVSNGHVCRNFWEHAHQPTHKRCAVEFADANRRADRHILIDEQFKRVGGCYEALEAHACSLALAKQNGKYGYINENGQTQIGFAYADARSFAWDTALVKPDGDKETWQVIDTWGEPLHAQGEPLVFEEVKALDDGPVFAVLSTQSCSYIVDHRYYDEDLLPAHEPEVICDPAAFMSVEGERLYRQEKPEDGELFCLTAQDCAAARLSLMDYIRHVESGGLHAQHRCGADGEQWLLCRSRRAPSHPGSYGYGEGAAADEIVMRELMTLRVQTGMQGDRLILTGSAHSPVRLIDDGARARFTRHDVPLTLRFGAPPLACMSMEAARKREARTDEQPPPIKQPRLPKTQAYRDCSRTVTQSQVERCLAVQFGDAWEVRQTDQARVYAARELSPQRKHCNTLPLGNEYFCVLVFYDEEGDGRTADIYYSREYRFD